MPRKKTIGSGIAKRNHLVSKVKTAQGVEAAKEYLRAFSQRDFTFEGLYGRPLEDLAKRILKSAGLDSRKSPIPAADSEEDYARRLLRPLRLIRANRNERFDDALRFALQLGADWMEGTI